MLISRTISALSSVLPTLPATLIWPIRRCLWPAWTVLNSKPTPCREGFGPYDMNIYELPPEPAAENQSPAQEPGRGAGGAAGRPRFLIERRRVQPAADRYLDPPEIQYGVEKDQRYSASGGICALLRFVRQPDGWLAKLPHSRPPREGDPGRQKEKRGRGDVKL